MNPRDVLLIVVALVGLAGGVLAPAPAGVFSPYVLYFMMTILFLSFLRIDFAALLRLGPAQIVQVAAWSTLKLLALPAALWGLCRLLAPDYALAVLLLSGVSTGVTAPFFATLLNANVERVLQTTVVTSLLVPLTLPALVELLMGAELTIPYWHMVRMLLLVIFAPLGASLVVRKLLPKLPALLLRVQFPLVLALFLVINLGVFARYAGFLRSHLGEVAMILLVCCLAALAHAGSGFALGSLSRGRLRGLDGAVAMTYINNILVVVFAARFFGPTESLLAAVYLLPLYLMLVPIRWFEQRQRNRQRL